MKEKIIELREQGCSYKEIQEQLGCSKSTISFHCSKMDSHKESVSRNIKSENDKRRKKAKAKPKNKKAKSKRKKKKYLVLTDQEANIVRLYSAYGISTNLLSDIFNVDLKRVRQICYAQAKRGRTTGGSLYDSVKEHRKRMKIAAILYKGCKCERCGYHKNISALEFHHKDPSKKEFGISASHMGWDLMKKELNKCSLLCSNCHREEHNPDFALKLIGS